MSRNPSNKPHQTTHYHIITIVFSTWLLYTPAIFFLRFKLILVNLAPLHTFALNYQAQQQFSFESKGALLSAAKEQELFKQPHLILGAGSNTLFTCDYEGAIIRLLNQELVIKEDHQFYYLRVAAGYDWHRLVQLTLERGIYGLENLALIPGSVGAAPIQNIGAYGVELADVLGYVEFIDKDSLEVVRLRNSQLQFGYRDSIFKHELADKVMITEVGIKLRKKWLPCTDYAGLCGLKSAQDVYNAVIKMRQDKLPDPAEIPNAGSFFKNPQISNEHYQAIKQRFSDVPGYASGLEMKVPAAWLIEQCGLKGTYRGGIGVYPDHGLVLINKAQGTGEELLELVTSIKKEVVRRFEIALEIEVRLMGATGLINAELE